MKPYENPDGKKQQVRTMFDAIAGRYDTLNHLLSLGIDRCWRKKVIRRVAACGPRTILDLATGTGDLALMLAKHCPGAQIRGVDLSGKMLEIAAEKVARAGLTGRISLGQGEAESLAEADRFYDAVTVAFGVRNFEDIPAGLSEISRVLTPGGKLWVLEFGLPGNRLLGSLYRFYFHRVLPWIGGVISRDKKAYRYLPESVDEFPYGAAFSGLMERAGFTEVSCTDLFGGVAQIYEGKIP